MKNKNPISIIQAVNQGYKEKEKQFMASIHEMLVETENLKVEGKEVNQIIQTALLQTLDSIVKLYTTIYNIDIGVKEHQA